MADSQTLNIRPPLWLPIIVVALAGSFYIAGKNIEKRAAETPGTIIVTGEGKVTVTPDIADVSFGMQTGRMNTAKAAMEKLSQSMNPILEAIKRQGVEEKDIKTENFALNPVYDWTNGGQVFRGFEANESLRVKVRDLDKVSDIVGAATTAGANQAGSVSFTVDHPEEKRAEARQMAIDQAKDKAQELARQLGVHLGALKGFIEQGNYAQPMMMRDSLAAPGMMEKSIPLPAGQQEESVSVTITYDLE